VEAVDGSAAEGSKIDLVGHGSTCDQNVKTEIINDEDDEMEEEFEDPDEVDDDVDMVDVPQPDSALRETESKETENQQKEVVEEKTLTEETEVDVKCENEKHTKETSKASESEKKIEYVNKELLQAFVFFDRNRVGYIKVDDLRFIIHILGKNLSHRDVKEMVHFALLESNNSSRENRILYHKLVKRSDI